MVRCGDALEIKCDVNGSCFRFTCTEIVHGSPVGGVPRNDSTCEDVSRTEHRVDEATDTEEESREETMSVGGACLGVELRTDVQPTTLYLLDRPDLGRLNDIHFNKTLSRAIQTILAQTTPSRRSVLDLTQGFSPLAVQSLKLGADYAHVATENETHKELLRDIAVLNGVDPSRLSFSDCKFRGQHREWSVIISELVETCGCMRQEILEDIALARYALSLFVALKAN